MHVVAKESSYILPALLTCPDYLENAVHNFVLIFLDFLDFCVCLDQTCSNFLAGEPYHVSGTVSGGWKRKKNTFKIRKKIYVNEYSVLETELMNK